MKADDRRELLGYIQRFDGLSKAAALSELKNCTEASLVKNLEGYRLRIAKEKFAQQMAIKTPVTPLEAPLKAERPKKVPYTLLMLPEQLEGLKALSDQDGASVSHHIRQAVRQYLRTQSR